MFDLTVPRSALAGAYPEQQRPRESTLDKVARAIAAPWVRRFRARRALATDFIDLVHREAPAFAGASVEKLRAAADEMRLRLRREGLSPALVARAFALVQATGERTMGMRHFDSQLAGGWVLMNGMIAEMETGEGKTLTATLPACTAALAGVPVHVITVNDYLTARDAELMRPLYRALGITVSTVVNGQSPDARRAAYGADITYCTNKELTFDYLRDRLALGAQSNRAQLQIERLAGTGNRASNLVLRGLYFAIVDEADSVLIDEARTPLVISSKSADTGEERLYKAALALARQLKQGTDFVADRRERQARLTPAGQARLAAMAPRLPEVFHGRRRREELVTQALVATHLFHRDTDYLVRDEKVQIIDESTGRILPDRSWERGLHQMIEAKESVPLTGQQTSLARMTYQRFFRRYLWLAGMTGTAQEVTAELWSVYGLPVVPVPTNRPVRRANLGVAAYATADEKWAAVVRRVKELGATGRPVLIGTRAVGASEHLSTLLAAAGIRHEVLNARQDEREAEIVAQAGQRGAVMVATNMAGRGTDIKLGTGVDALGGLHVIATEFHEAGRIDRQLFGRSARQGDPGSFESIVSLEDEVMRLFGGLLGRPLARTLIGTGRGRGALVTALFRRAQRRGEAYQAAIRRDLLTTDERMGDLLAFSGKGE